MRPMTAVTVGEVGKRVPRVALVTGNFDEKAVQSWRSVSRGQTTVFYFQNRGLSDSFLDRGLSLVYHAAGTMQPPNGVTGCRSRNANSRRVFGSQRTDGADRAWIQP